MAWIKVEHVLPDKPEVIQMATLLGMDLDAVVGKLVRFWIWADGNTSTGNALTVTALWLDRFVHCDGFTAAMVKVGWLKGADGAYSIAHFARHNAQSAKGRALTANRVAGHRTKAGNASVTRESLPEKRREEAHTTCASPGEPGEQESIDPDEAPADALTKAFTSRFWPEGVPPRKRAHVIALVADLRAMKATPDELTARCVRWRSEWATMALTPEAIVKHWSHFEASVASERAAPTEAPMPNMDGATGSSARRAESIQFYREAARTKDIVKDMEDAEIWDRHVKGEF